MVVLEGSVPSNNWGFGGFADIFDTGKGKGAGTGADTGAGTGAGAGTGTGVVRC